MTNSDLSFRSSSFTKFRFSGLFAFRISPQVRPYGRNGGRSGKTDNRDVEDAVPYIRDTYFLHGASRIPRATGAHKVLA